MGSYIKYRPSALENIIFDADAVDQREKVVI